MLRHYGEFDPEGWLGSVFAHDDEDEAPEGRTLLVDWGGWPPSAGQGLRLRLVDGALAWQDPRTADEQSADARARRDALLRETDWMVIRDSEGGDKMTPEWKAYRKALRDVTRQGKFPNTIEWPEPPPLPSP